MKFVLQLKEAQNKTVNLPASMKKEHVEVLKRRTLKLMVTEGVYASLHVTWCRQIIKEVALLMYFGCDYQNQI